MQLQYRCVRGSLLLQRYYVYQIEVKGFRAIGEKPVSITLRPLTILFGPNASGKTSIIEALYFIFQQFIGGDEIPGTDRRRGSTEINVLLRDETGIYKLVDVLRDIAQDIMKELVSIDRLVNQLASQIVMRFSMLREFAAKIANNIAENLMSYMLGTLSIEFESPISTKLKLIPRIVVWHAEEYIEKVILNERVVLDIVEKALEKTLLTHGHYLLPLRYREYRSRIVAELVNTVRDVIRDMMRDLKPYIVDLMTEEDNTVLKFCRILPVLWIPAWRDWPTAEVKLGELEPRLTAVRILTSRTLIHELATLSLMPTEREIESTVRELTSTVAEKPALSEPCLKLSMNGIIRRRTHLKLLAKLGNSLYPEDLAADGERSLHTLIYGLALARHGFGTLLIEEPELHVHPRLQYRIAQLIVDIVNKGAQIVVSTHSDHLIAAVLEAVLSGRLDQSKVIAYYIRREDDAIKAISIEFTPEKIVEHADILSEFVEADIAAYKSLLNKLM